MNSAQVDALRTLVRRVVAADLDELYTRISALEAVTGIDPRPAGETARQEQVKRLHAHVSQRTIARLLDVNRATVAADVARLGLEPSPDAVDAAGRQLGGMARRDVNGHTNGAPPEP